jgi:hypothetical protein
MYTFVNTSPTIYDKNRKQAAIKLKFENTTIAGLPFAVFPKKDLYIDATGKARFIRKTAEDTFCILDGNVLYLAATCTREKMESALSHYLKINPNFVAQQLNEWKQSHAKN